MATLNALPATIAKKKIELQGITKEFPTRNGSSICALAQIDLQVCQGEFLCIVGPSGCGKSTLLHIIAGLDCPTSGKIFINGSPAGSPGPDRILILQELGLFPWLTVLENVEFV